MDQNDLRHELLFRNTLLSVVDLLFIAKTLVIFRAGELNFEENPTMIKIENHIAQARKSEELDAGIAELISQERVKLRSELRQNPQVLPDRLNRDLKEREAGSRVASISTQVMILLDDLGHFRQHDQT